MPVPDDNCGTKEAVGRLLDHMQSRSDEPVTEADVHRKYAPVLAAADVPNAVEVAILIDSIDVRLDLEFAGPILALAPDEASYRLSRLKDWIGRFYMHDVIVTPVLAEFLARPGDFEAKLTHLDRLADATGRGEFDASDPLQRDLEYQKFSHEYHRLYGTNRKLPYVNEPPSALYRKFVEFPVLDHEHRDEACLDDHLLEIRRAGYEAAGFLRFLRRFRAGTSRPIVVVGNNRYGRQWIVEPLAAFSATASPYVTTASPPTCPRGSAWRLLGTSSSRPTTPARGPPTPFQWSSSARWTGTCHTSWWRTPRALTGSRLDDALQGRQDLRELGGGIQLRAGRGSPRRLPGRELPACRPPGTAGALVRVRQGAEAARGVGRPGADIQRRAVGAQTTDTAHLGEIPVPFRAPALDTDEPQFILANPLVYDDAALPEHLRGTSPYYLDGPEKYVKEEIVFGFGPYGFQPAIKGTMTASFVAAAQRAIAEEVASLTAGEGG